MSPSKKKQQSNQTLERNLKALEQKQPLLVQRIREFMRTQMKSGAKFGIQTEETPRGSWWKGFYDEPFFESNDALNATPEGTKPVLVVAGIGTPRYLVGLLNRIQRRQFVILLEPNIKLLLFLLESSSLFDHKAPFELFLLLAGEDALLNEMQQAAFGHRGHFLGGVFDVHTHPGVMEVASEVFRETLKKYVGRINYQMQRLGDSAEDTLLGFRQMALATPWILFRESLAPLEGKFKGFSGVVLSAGPSLDKNLHLLKGMEDRLVIVTADTLLSKLAVQGIHPHFVCALERGTPTYENYFRPLYDRQDPFLEDIFLVVQSVCVPQIAGRWPGRLAVVGKKDINLDRIVIEDALGGSVLRSGASVAHMALGLLSYLGVDRVALVGQDLAFGENGQTHTNQTSWDHTDAVELSERRTTVPGALGGFLETTVAWKFFVDVFEEMIPQMPFSVWDCTEGGALIRGAEFRPLSDYLAGVGKPPKSSFFVLKEQIGAETKSGHSRSASKGLNDLKESFLKSRRQIETARSMLAHMETLPCRKETLVGPINEFYNLLQSLTEENPVLTYIGQSYLSTLLAVEASLSFSDEEEFLRWCRSHKEFFDAQERTVSLFLDWLAYMTISAGLTKTYQELGVFSPPDEKRIQSSLEGFLARSQERLPELDEIVLADYLHSRVDPVSAKWEPVLLWALARHLHGEGRFVEASTHFQAAIQGFEGRSIAVEAAAALLKDRAKSLMGRDLCWTGMPLEALTSLANAYSYTPDDEEIPNLLEELLRRRRVDNSDQLVLDIPEAKRKYLEATVKALDEELEKMGDGGAGRADVVHRYLVAILEGKHPEEIVDAKECVAKCRKEKEEIEKDI